MKIKNFRNKRKINGYFCAEIDIETGLLFKKVITETVFKLGETSYWRYLGSGEFTPCESVEILELAYDAQQAISKDQNEQL